MNKLLLNGLMGRLLNSAGIVVGTCLILNEGIAAEGGGGAGGPEGAGIANPDVAGGDNPPVEDPLAADKIAADKIAADKIAADKVRKRLEKEAAKRAAAASTSIVSSTTSSVDKIAADKIAADKERKRLEKEAAKRAAAASTSTLSSTTSSIDKIAADKIAADKIAADKIATDKIAADKIAANKIAADKVRKRLEKEADDKIATDKIAADKIAADKIATDKIAADKERKRLEKEAAKRAAAASTPQFSSTTRSIKPTHELSEEEEDKKLNVLINNQYKKILSDIKGKLTACTSRSDCLDKSKIVFKNALESLGAKASYGYGNSSYSSYSSSSKPELPDEPVLRDSERYVKGRYSKWSNESDKEFTERLQQEINNHYEDKIEDYDKKVKKYKEDIAKWKNQNIREKTRKMVEDLQTFFQNVYDRDIFPAEMIIYEHLSESGKKDYLAHRLVTDPLKVRIYAGETTLTTGKKKDDNALWAKIGVGAIGGTILGMLAPSTPTTPPPAPGAQRPGQRPGTPQQGYQSPYATPKPGTQSQQPAQRPSTPGGYGTTPARPQQPKQYQQPQQPRQYQQPQKPQQYQQPQQSGRYQNNSYSVGEGAAFLQPIVFGEAFGYDYSYDSKPSYSSSYGSKSYSSSSAPAGKKEIPPKEYRFNKDDVLLFAMDEIEKKHRSCSNYKDCLKQDSDRISAIANGLGEKDPSRDVLLEIADEIESRAKVSNVKPEDIIDAFEKAGYEPVGSSLKTKLREDWEKITNTRSKSRTSREPKVTNEVELKKAHAKVIKAEEKKIEKKKEYPQQGKQTEPAKKEEGGVMGLLGKLFG